mgnify:FL=1
MAMEHDNPELRAQVRRELLYPATPKPEPGLTVHQRMALVDLHQKWHRSVGSLCREFDIPEETIREVIGEAA